MFVTDVEYALDSISLAAGLPQLSQFMVMLERQAHGIIPFEVVFVD